MFPRRLANTVKELSLQLPIVTIMGPRQSGKTTLAKALFPHKPYVNMEDANNRELALVDPKSFLQKYPQGAILDEIQKTPHLLSQIQVLVDEANQQGMFILTGSHQSSLHAAVAQSLAGRTALVKLLPLTLEELRLGKVKDPLEQIILKGSFPRIYKENLSFANAYSSYFQTYVEKDIRQLLQVKDLYQFEKFIKLVASRIGQVINYTSLSNEVGVSSVTIKQWISVLESTYILFRLEPYFENFGKRLIKSPKIYFTDTGLACHLLGIENQQQLISDALFGSLFENWVILELMKYRLNQGLDPRFYFYRTTDGKEIDLLIQQGSRLIPIEIKSSKTFSSAFLKGLDYFHLTTSKAKDGFLIYRGEESQKIQSYTLLNPENFLTQVQ